MPAFKRILLKLSGEVLAGGASFGIDSEKVKSLAREVADVAAAGIEIPGVVGGGGSVRNRLRKGQEPGTGSGRCGRRRHRNRRSGGRRQYLPGRGRGGAEDGPRDGRSEERRVGKECRSRSVPYAAEK